MLKHDLIVSAALWIPSKRRGEAMISTNHYSRPDPRFPFQKNACKQVAECKFNRLPLFWSTPMCSTQTNDIIRFGMTVPQFTLPAFTVVQQCAFRLPRETLANTFLPRPGIAGDVVGTGPKENVPAELAVTVANGKG